MSGIGLRIVNVFQPLLYTVTPPVSGSQYTPTW